MSDIRTQYRIIESGAGWVERAGRGRVRIEGADRAAFLQALVTNDLEQLAPGRGVYTAYLTPQGRLIADMRLYERGDHVLADVPAALAASLVTRLDALVFSEDVRLADVTATTSVLGVMGHGAETLLDRALDLPPGTLAGLSVLGVAEQPSRFVARTDDAECPIFDVFMPEAARAAVLAGFAAAGIEHVSDALANLLRIEAGRPAFGSDMDEHTIPLEAGLVERAISLTKGCFVGQEVIVRVLHRGGGRVARRLVRLAFEPALTTPPAPGTTLRANGQEAGRVTSAAWSPRLERVVALGYLARDVAEPGRDVRAMAADGEWRADVLGLAG